MANAAMTEETRNIVIQAIEARILEALTKSAAKTEKNLRGHVASVQETRGQEAHAGYNHTRTRHIPEPIITEALKGLNEAGIIRRIRCEGTTYVATADATKEQIIEAVKTHKRTEGRARWIISPETRRERYLLGETKTELAKPMPLDADDDISPERRAGIAGAYAEEENFGLSYNAAEVADYMEAEIPRTIDGEDRYINPARSKEISEVAQRRIAYQMERPGMARRNAEKVKARWIKSEAGREWMKIKRLANQRKEEEKALFAEDLAATA